MCNSWKPSCALFIALFGVQSAIGSDASKPIAVPAFRLPTAEDLVVEVDRGGPAKLTVVCFLGCECPLARLYGPRLSALAKEFAPRGVHFIAVNSNVHDTMDDLRQYAASHDITFPVAKDYDNVVADQYGATRTPHVFVLDVDLAIRYRGRVDDQFRPGIARAAPEREDLRLAIEELLAGQAVTLPQTEPAGCFIGRKQQPGIASDVTYSKQVSRVLQQHCVECHRPGEIGPFSLTDYDEVVGWTGTILEVIEDGRMPPWHASPEHGEFANARHVADGDKQILKDWVAAGAPYGNVSELPEPITYVEGWQLPREPDLVLAMRDRPFVVPASGTVEYQYFVVDPQLAEDKWVRAAQVIAGNRSVVHHAIVFIRPPDGSEFRGIGWLAGYVPGQRAAVYPPGAARRVPAGSKLVFQMHYTPNGAEASDVTKVGIVFADPDEVTHEVVTQIAIDQGFEIPPNAAEHQVHTEVQHLPDGGLLLSIMPHMHLRGKSFHLFVQRGENREPLLQVPRYDFNWQHIYQLAEPMPLSDVDALECDVVFDNSVSNPFNPDPSQYVTWGDQTWEEMAVAFFDISVPLNGDGSLKPIETTSASADPSPAPPEAIEDFVDRFVNLFDANSDGEVRRAETPDALRAFGFGRLDLNGDDVLSRDELRVHARERLGR
jgi:hypothetical protein